MRIVLIIEDLIAIILLTIAVWNDKKFKKIGWADYAALSMIILMAITMAVWSVF